MRIESPKLSHNPPICTYIAVVQDGWWQIRTVSSEQTSLLRSVCSHVSTKPSTLCWATSKLNFFQFASSDLSTVRGEFTLQQSKRYWKLPFRVWKWALMILGCSFRFPSDICFQTTIFSSRGIRKFEMRIFGLLKSSLFVLVVVLVLSTVLASE